MQQRNVSIEAFRFFFMVNLCLWHMEESIHFQYHGYLVVEFFFMLSGVLLYRSFLRHPEIGNLEYTVRKVKRFWIEYFIAMVLTFFMYYRGIFEKVSVQSNTAFEKGFNFTLQLITDSLMIRGGIFLPMGNWPTWYLSVLLIGGAIIYALLKNYHRQSITLFLPLACLIIYGYFFPQGKEQHIENWDTINGFSMPIVRGVAEMGTGVLLYRLFIQKKATIIAHHLLLNWLSAISLVILILMMVLPEFRDAYVIVFMPVFIMGLLYEDSWWNKMFKSRVWLFLGGLTYEMLLVHMFVRGPLVNFSVHEWMNPWLMGALYITIVLVLSYLLKQLGASICKRIGW
ncbi:MAG: acyltransferase [Bacteroidaceae bacterium]|nr:acyltransferase [Bacteroidaceae bacterium]